MFPKLAFPIFVALIATVSTAQAQEAVSSITQSRLFTAPAAPTATSYDANGNAVESEADTTFGDGSFGAQIILKNQEKPREFDIFADASVFYTNNVDLTPSNTRSDEFVAATIGAAWRPIINRNLVGEISAATSVFRYNEASGLDFERISAGAGFSWVVPRGRGIVVFARYDFTEVLDTRSDELLQDHAFTLGGQKAFVFGRSHFLTTGIAGVMGISTPRSEERDQAAVHALYHLQFTRSFGGDVIYRYAAQFYSEAGRIDHNQTLALALGVAVNRWLRVSASVSGARNVSNRSVFEYDVINLGGGIRADVRF